MSNAARKLLLLKSLTGSSEGSTTPLQQGHSLAFSVREETTETIAWSNPGIIPDGYLIVAKSGSAVNSDPVDGISYTDNTVFGSGTQIGSGNYVVGNVLSSASLLLTITGLTAGTFYHYKIYAYNGSGSGIKYRTLDEKGHLWQSLTMPHEVIGMDVASDGTIVICGGTKISYSTNNGQSWTQWADLVGEAFHSMIVCEQGTIHNASGTPVSRKYIFPSHSGTGKVYAGYTPGDVLETLITGATGQTWNDPAWNYITSNLCVAADSSGGAQRIAILANARTVTYQTTLDADSIASVCATPGAADGTEFIAVFKNASVSGQAAAKRVAGSWTRKSTPVGRVYHYVRFMPELGTSGRVGVTSAEGLGNDALYSDDFFESYNLVAITGAYGAWCWDSTYRLACAVSRTPGQSILVSTDFITWDSVSNPVANAVWFNVRPVGTIFIAGASSGSSLGMKTTPSNIGNAETRYNDYNDWIAAIQAAGFALGSDAQNTWVKNLTYAYQDGGYRNKIKCIRVWGYGSNKNALTFNLRNPATHRAIEVNTITFLDGSGTRSSGTSYMRSAFTPSVHASGVNNFGITAKCTDGSVNSKVLYGTNDGSTANRTSLNPRDAAGNLATVACNCTSVAGAANPSSATGVYTNQRDGATAANHKIWKSTAVGNAAIIDPSNNTTGGLSSLEVFENGLNNNGALSLADDVRYLSAIAYHDHFTDAEVLHFHNALHAAV